MTSRKGEEGGREVGDAELSARAGRLQEGGGRENWGFSPLLDRD